MLCTACNAPVFTTCHRVYGKSDKEAKAVASDIASGSKTAAKTVTRSASKFGKKLKKVF